MAFQPAVIGASNGLLATPAAGASNAPSAGDAGLFQSLLAGAAGEATVTAATPNAAAQAAPSGAALALLLQAQPEQTATSLTDEAAPATEPQAKPATPATHNATAESAPKTDQPATPVPPAAVEVEAQAVADAPEQQAPAQQHPATAAAATPDVAQAIIFAPFAALAAPAAISAAPAAAAATPVKGSTAPLIEADAPPQSGLFRKTAFTAQTKTESASGAITKIAGEALATPQTQTPARAETAQPGAASPITGFDAPRAATDSLSTPVARAMHGAAPMQVAQNIARRFDGQSTNFEVRLDPAELGRVDVKISVDHDKRVTAAVSADSAQTLSDLRGAARDIERALNEAGLDLAQGGLSFDLNQRQARDEQFDAASYAAADVEESDSAETVTIAARPFGMERWSASGVDVWA